MLLLFCARILPEEDREEVIGKNFIGDTDKSATDPPSLS
jgi:hypothetical protein